MNRCATFHVQVTNGPGRRGGPQLGRWAGMTFHRRRLQPVAAEMNTVVCWDGRSAEDTHEHGIGCDEYDDEDEYTDMK